MPVNMDPSKKRRRATPDQAPDSGRIDMAGAAAAPKKKFGEETEADREKDLADAELKNLWDATEVIDMDKV